MWWEPTLGVGSKRLTKARSVKQCPYSDMAITLERRTLAGLGYAALLLPAIFVIGLFFAVPLARIVLLSFHAPDFTLIEYIELGGDDIRLIVLARTLWIAFVVTVASLFVGYPTAYLLHRIPDRFRPLLLLLVVLPLWMSILVRTYAWMVILGRTGIVNTALQASGVTDGPLQLLYVRFSVYVGMIHVMLPFMILPIFNTLRQSEPRLMQAAKSLGASPQVAFFCVFLPLSLPGIAAGCSLVFILSLGFFVTPALLGGARDTTFVMLIERTVNALRDWEMAAAMSVVLLALTLVLVVITQRGLASGPGDRASRAALSSARALARGALAVYKLFGRLGWQHTESEGAPQSRRTQQGPGWTLSALGYGSLLFLTLPIVVIIILAFSSAPFLTFPPPGLSVRWFENYFTRPDWLAATLVSIQVALITMVAGTILGILASIALVRSSFPGKLIVLAFLIAPIVVPTVVLAIALYFVFARFGLVGTRTGLVLGHVVLAIPYVIIVMSGALRSVDVSLERAAQTLGASPVRAFLRITLPQLRPAVVTAALFAFLASFDELVIALFISGTGAKTLPKRMWEGIREEIDPTTAAVAALLIAVSLLLLITSELARLRVRRNRPEPRMIAADR